MQWSTHTKGHDSRKPVRKMKEFDGKEDAENNRGRGCDQSTIQLIKVYIVFV